MQIFASCDLPFLRAVASVSERKVREFQTFEPWVVHGLHNCTSWFCDDYYDLWELVTKAGGS